jgi:hypothetical protein
VSPTSFDPPRARVVPAQLVDAGGSVLAELDATTLVAVVKPSCDGCRSFTHGDLGALRGVRVVVVSATDSPEWADARRPVLVAPSWVASSGVRGAPHYVLVDRAGAVLSEGVLFSPAQVREEITPYLG